MLTVTDVIYYQPQHEDGSMPEGLAPNQAFISEEAAAEWLYWLDEEGNEDIDIREYCNDDLADVELLDGNGNPLPKIESLTDGAIAGEICDYVLSDIGTGWEPGTAADLRIFKNEGETEDEYNDRLYTKALDLINEAIGHIEEDQEYDFTSYGGNPDTEWYDEAREIAIFAIIRWMRGD
jgi:hypothetical protein